MAAPRRRMAPGHVRRCIRLPLQNRAFEAYTVLQVTTGLFRVRRREPGGNAVLRSLRRASRTRPAARGRRRAKRHRCAPELCHQCSGGPTRRAEEQLPEERRLITALFADVSGFTSLAERLDPSSSSRSSIPVISGLSTIVGRYEGYVEKFAGDALLALFGAPISHEDDAERALLVALEMHEDFRADVRAATARSRAQRPHRGQLGSRDRPRAGKRGANGLRRPRRLGDPRAAARVGRASGTTYVSDSTYRMTSNRFEFAPVGELTLKGKQEAVRAWQLIGRRSTAATRRASRLVGRDRELSAAARVLEPGTTVAVSGEAAWASRGSQTSCACGQPSRASGGCRHAVSPTAPHLRTGPRGAASHDREPGGSVLRSSARHRKRRRRSRTGGLPQRPSRCVRVLAGGPRPRAADRHLRRRSTGPTRRPWSSRESQLFEHRAPMLPLSGRRVRKRALSSTYSRRAMGRFARGG